MNAKTDPTDPPWCITQLQTDVDEFKAQRKATNKHITYAELPEAARFDRLSTQSKHLLDTVKMIAYCAETAMVQIVRQKMMRHDDARSLLRAIYRTEVDILPVPQAKTLTIRLHPLANQSSDNASDISATSSTKLKHYSPEPNCA